MSRTKLDSQTANIRWHGRVIKKVLALRDKDMTVSQIVHFMWTHGYPEVNEMQVVGIIDPYPGDLVDCSLSTIRAEARRRKDPYA